MARILLVDDETIVRTLVAVALRRGNHEVLEAASGTQALTLLRKAPGPVDLLVSELALPRMNGIELAARIAETHPETAALFLSRAPHAAMLERQAGERGCRVLRKPFEVAVLLGEAANRVERGPGARKPAAADCASRPGRQAKAGNGSSGG
jgi:hypothetical protein